MKICPACDSENSDGDPICRWCDANIADAKRVPHPDPNHPEHERNLLASARRRSVRNELAFAVGLYACIVAGTAAYPGLVWSPLPLGCYFVGAVITGWLVAAFGYDAKWMFSILQGAISVALVCLFGPVHPITFFVLATHIILPMLLGIWCEMIYDMNR